MFRKIEGFSRKLKITKCSQAKHFVKRAIKFKDFGKIRFLRENYEMYCKKNEKSLGNFLLRTLRFFTTYVVKLRHVSYIYDLIRKMLKSFKKTSGLL